MIETRIHAAGPRRPRPRPRAATSPMGVLIGAALGLVLLAIAGPAGAVRAAPAARPDAAAADSDPYARVRGMTISCRGAGRSWGSDEMVETMRTLRDLGVNWVTIHPYAGISRDGTVGSSRIDGLYRDPVWLTRPIAEAHRLGLKIMIKPHIAYWGSGFSWRGDITFETDAQWARFFATYEAWITMVAALSREADAFVVGTELGGTTRHETEWRKIIGAVRAKTDVPLTYAANWDSYERVGFWDALDAIGIQGYFPLVDHARLPEQAELDWAWTELVERLERYGAAHRRPVVLAELGYNRSSLAARQPWEYRQGGEHAEEIQRRCMRAALAAIDRSETVSGAFLWKWFPGERSRGNFLMSTPAMRAVIGERWGGHAVSAPVE